jgi:hypothetical protein
MDERRDDLKKTEKRIIIMNRKRRLLPKAFIALGLKVFVRYSQTS